MIESFKKKKALKDLEYYVVDALEFTARTSPEYGEKEIKHGRKVIKMFLSYCSENYSAEFIAKNSKTRSKAMALWNKYLTMKAKQREKFKVVK